MAKFARMLMPMLMLTIFVGLSGDDACAWGSHFRVAAFGLVTDTVGSVSRVGKYSGGTVMGGQHLPMAMRDGSAWRGRDISRWRDMVCDAEATEAWALTSLVLAAISVGDSDQPLLRFSYSKSGDRWIRRRCESQLNLDPPPGPKG